MKTKFALLNNFQIRVCIVLSIFIMTFSITSIYSQDIIIKNNKTEIKSKVLEITEQEIKYKKIEFLEGPTYAFDKAEVFMIIYANGKKEYFESSASSSKPIFFQKSKNKNLPKDQNVLSNKDEVENYKFLGSVAIDDHLKTLDFEDNFKIKDNLYWGFSLYTSKGFFTNGGIYPYLAYKYPVNKNFLPWINAGYNYSWIGNQTISTDFGTVNINGSSGGSFLWEIGADYFFSKHTGITLYSPKANGIFLGIVFRRDKY